MLCVAHISSLEARMPDCLSSTARNLKLFMFFDFRSGLQIVSCGQMNLLSLQFERVLSHRMCMARLEFSAAFGDCHAL